MQFSLALVLAVAGAAVQARPGTVSADFAKIDTSNNNNNNNNNNVEARGLISDLLSGIGGVGHSTTATATSASSSSSQTSSVTSSSSSSTSASGAASAVPTGVKTYGNDRIETIHTAGTSGDRVGFKWAPVDTSE